jgi:hypothetical protein
MASTSSLFCLTTPKGEKGTLQTLDCHDEVPRILSYSPGKPRCRAWLETTAERLPNPAPRRVGQHLHQEHWNIPAHPEALCRPPSGVEMPGSGHHAMSCLTGQHCRGPIGKAATTGQAGWVVPLGVASSLQPQHLVTDGSRFAAAHRCIQVELEPFGN